MSFHNVTLPSAPNLYSSWPVALLRPESQAAFSKIDEGVESGSPASWLTSGGSKPPGIAVHWVTLPSAPSLNSCCPPAPVLPLNHTAPANSKRVGRVQAAPGRVDRRPLCHAAVKS